MTVANFIVCDDQASYCRCVLPTGHHGPHACVDLCGGQWTYDADGRFLPLEWPLGFLAGWETW